MEKEKRVEELREKAKELKERDLGDLLLMEIRKDLVEDKN